MRQSNGCTYTTTNDTHGPSGIQARRGILQTQYIHWATCVSSLPKMGGQHRIPLIFTIRLSMPRQSHRPEFDCYMYLWFLLSNSIHVPSSDKCCPTLLLILRYPYGSCLKRHPKSRRHIEWIFLSVLVHCNSNIQST